MVSFYANLLKLKVNNILAMRSVQSQNLKDLVQYIKFEI